MNRYLAVMAGGALGSVTRYAVNVAVYSLYRGRFPLATFLINVCGSFLIGLAMTLLASRTDPLLRLLLVTGVLGGFTTFSAFEWEAYASPVSIAWPYVIASVAAGFAACWAGAEIATLMLH